MMIEKNKDGEDESDRTLSLSANTSSSLNDYGNGNNCNWKSVIIEKPPAPTTLMNGWLYEQQKSRDLNEFEQLLSAKQHNEDDEEDEKEEIAVATVAINSLSSSSSSSSSSSPPLLSLSSDNSNSNNNRLKHITIIEKRRVINSNRPIVIDKSQAANDRSRGKIQLDLDS